MINLSLACAVEGNEREDGMEKFYDPPGANDDKNDNDFCVLHI